MLLLIARVIVLLAQALGRLIGQASPPRTRYAGNRTLRHPITGEHLDDAIVLGFTGEWLATALYNRRISPTMPALFCCKTAQKRH
jgi:hypothetical protein